MLRVLLAGLAIALAAPVVAQDEVPTGRLFAKALIGFADGAQIGFTEDTAPYMREVAPGVFEIMGPGKKHVLYSFLEIEPCMIRVVAKMDPPQKGSLTADVSRISSITLEPQAAHESVPGWRVEVVNEPGSIVSVNEAGVSSETDISTTFYSTVPLAEMEAAAATLLERCAGIVPPAVSLADTSAVDLLATIFAGVAPGLAVEMNSVRGPAIRIADGVYQIRPETGEPAMSLAVRQQGRCRFLFTAGVEGDREFSARLNADLISAITVEPDGDRGDLKAFKVSIAGDEGRLETLTAEGDWEAPPSADSFMTTPLALRDIEAAIMQFRTEYCPGK